MNLILTNDVFTKHKTITDAQLRSLKWPKLKRHQIQPLLIPLTMPYMDNTIALPPCKPNY